ncbi:MAG TPA: hypothetical protein P5195_08040, partial [Anaerolineae bacterium]|nr:hypothetical protein [Anaerolineae bacterium]
VVMGTALLAEWHRGIRGYRRADAARITVLLTVAQVLGEGYRWQMLPLYALVGALFLPQAFSRRRAPAPAPWRKGSLIAALLVLALGAALLALLPVPRLPQPEGPYRIGTTTYHWVDSSRSETYGPGALDYRLSFGRMRQGELLVQVWYPAEPQTGVRTERWLVEGVPMARALARWGKMPVFLLDQLALVQTHTYANLPAVQTDAPYPVILYVHGWGGFRNVNQDQLEALAAQGYVVISADHAYSALRSVYPDGRVAENNPEALRGERGEDEFTASSRALMATYVADVRFILDQLPQLDAGGPLAGMFDLERIGLFGHSTGGGAVMAVCAGDARCKAVLGMDVWIEPVDAALLAAGQLPPALFLNSEQWLAGPNRALLEDFYHGLAGPAYWVDIAGSVHYDFTLVAIFSPLSRVLGVRGPLPGRQALAINRAYLLAFFDATLKGKPSPLLEGPPAEFPEVSFSRLP